MKRIYKCDWCGEEFERHECYMKGKKHCFCCRKCLANFSSRAKNPDGYLSLKDYTNMAINFSRLAKELNPSRMTPQVKAKIRDTHLAKGKGDGYVKYYGRHEHRAVAEQMLGRELKSNEVVHHIDGNPQNNSPNNLFVFPSQREHAEHHAFLKYILGEGGDAE